MNGLQSVVPRAAIFAALLVFLSLAWFSRQTSVRSANPAFATVDAAGIVHCVVGKLSFGEQQLAENVEALLKHIIAIKPNTSKGIYVRSIYVTATMMPSIAISA